MNNQMSRLPSIVVKDECRATVKHDEQCPSPLDEDDVHSSARHTENVYENEAYENEADHGLYVDMNSPHFGLYVTSGSTATPSTNHSDDENIYEEIDCTKLPALPGRQNEL